MPAQPNLTFPRVGQHWPEQGGRFMGICPGQNGQADYCLIASNDPRTRFTDVKWGNRGQEVAGATSDWDGATNTLAMNAAGSKLANDILTLEIDGFAGFYLPARHELRMIKLVAPDLIEEDWHWSSTQYSAHTAWVQGFTDGYQYNYDKSNEFAARAVRRFLII